MAKAVLCKDDNMNNIDNEVKEAYADCWMDNINKAYKIRNLNFIASEYISKTEAYYILNKYVKSYNSFSPELLNNLPNDIQVLIAREGSVRRIK